MFLKRIFEHVTLLVMGAVLATAKRTVTSDLRVIGRGYDQSFQNYHHVLNLAQ
jgi:hypothetical protein